MAQLARRIVHCPGFRSSAASKLSLPGVWAGLGGAVWNAWPHECVRLIVDGLVCEHHWMCDWATSDVSEANSPVEGASELVTMAGRGSQGRLDARQPGPKLSGRDIWLIGSNRTLYCVQTIEEIGKLAAGFLKSAGARSLDLLRIGWLK